MIAFVCFVIFAALALRSLALAGFEPKSLPVRLGNFLLALLFGACAAFLFLFAHEQFLLQPLPAAAIAIVVILAAAISVHHRRSRPRHHGPFVLLLKAIVLMFALCIALLVIMMSGFLTLTEDQPLMKITMTGNTRNERIGWQPPNGTPQSQVLTEREVVFETPDGKPIGNVFLYGDQVAVKVKVLRFRPILNVIGIRNLAAIDFVYNGYTTAERHNFYPHHAVEISAAPPALQPLQKTFWSLWEDLYSGNSRFWLIKSATLESNFFPLVHPDGSPVREKYFLTVNTGGLSAVPLP